MTDVTRILNAIEQGDARATDELLPLVYAEGFGFGSLDNMIEEMTNVAQ